MEKAFTFLRSIMGASWFMKLLGALGVVGGVATVVKQGIETNGVPSDPLALFGYLAAYMGLGQLGTKQVNVTNAKEANVVAQVVPKVDPSVETVTIPPVPKG
jgi:hypothetical protein